MPLESSTTVSSEAHSTDEPTPWWQTVDGGSWLPLLGSAGIAGLLLAIVAVANAVR